MVSLYLLTQYKVQNYLSSKAQDYLKEKLHTEVNLDRIEIDFFNRVHCKGLYIADEKKDTLAYIGDLSFKTNSLFRVWWYGEKAIVNEVKLKDAFVNIYNSKENKWNFDFIIDAFDTGKKDSTKKSQDPEFDIKKIALDNVRFNMSDAWQGQEVKTNLQHLALSIDELNIKDKRIAVEQFILDKTEIAYNIIPRAKPKSDKAPDMSDWGKAFNPDNFIINAKEIAINDIHFSYNVNGKVGAKNYFDEDDIIAKHVYLQLTNTNLVGDTLYTKITKLQAEERCGLEIKSLQADVVLNQQLAELKNLKLRTAYSEVQNYYAMRYHNFHDFEDYIGSVSMLADFNNAKIDKRDIEYFAHQKISQIPNLVRLNRKAEGTINNLFSNDIELDAGATYYKGNARIIGLPNVDETIFHFNAKQFKTTGTDLMRYVPEVKNDGMNWNALNSIAFQGTFDGTIKKFTSKGSLNTNQGNAIIDLQMNFEPKTPTYQAYVKTNKLLLGNIITQKDIGTLSMNGLIKGAGFDMNSIHTKIDAHVEAFYFQGKMYSDVNVNGVLNPNIFEGKVVSTNAQNNIDFNGKIDFNSEHPNYNFNSKFARLNLQDYGITKEPVYLTATADLNMQGKNLNDLVGVADLKDVVLQTKDKLIPLEYVRFEAKKSCNHCKELILNSSLADARLDGTYQIEDIWSSLQLYLSHYIPNYIHPPKKNVQAHFTYNIDVKNADDVIKIFEPNITVYSGTHIEGLLSTESQILNLSANIPALIYDGMQYNNVLISSNGNFEKLNCNAKIENFILNGNEYVKDANLDLELHDDTVNMTLKTKPDIDILGDAYVQCQAVANNNDLIVSILPSSINVKDDKWTLSATEPVIITEEGMVLVKDVKFENGLQYFLLNTSEVNGKNNAVVSVRQVDLERISDYAGLDDYVIRGRADAKIEISDLHDKLEAKGFIFTSNDLRINKDTLGLATLSFTYDKESNKLNLLKGTSLDYKNSYIHSEGNINFNNNTIDIKSDIQEASLSLLNQFLEGTVDRFAGSVSGNFSVAGNLSSPTILGNVNTKDAMLRIVFSGCTYRFSDASFNFNNSEIKFNPISIFDERPNPGKAILTGTVKHKDFDKYRLDLRVNSKDLLGLNTAAETGELFYGKINAETTMKITGALDDVTMEIAAKPLSGSKFYLPINSTGDVGTYDYIKFKTVGRDQTFENEKSNNTYFKVVMNIEATPEVETHIILDSHTGEEIISYGSGNLKLSVDLGNNIEMFQTYTVDSGLYKFNFRGILPKDFNLEKGGTISWHGDPFKADINMNAVYNTRLSLYPLIAADVEAGILDAKTYGDEISQAKQIQKTELKIALTGLLTNPDIKFDIAQPENKNISIANTRFESIRKDQNELISQAGMVLLFNTLRAPQGNLSAASMLSTSTASTVSEIIGSQLSPLLNNVINKITGLQNISVDINYKNYTTDVGISGQQGTNSAVRNTVNANLSGRFFKDKVLVELGNTIDFSTTAASSNSKNLFYLGDFRAQYLLTDDGRYRLNAFRVGSYDYVQNSPVQKAGIGLTYRRVFDTWSELFSPRKKEKPLDSLPLDEQSFLIPDDTSKNVYWKINLLGYLR